MTRAYLRQINIKSVTAITEVFAEGQKVTAVAIEYTKSIDNSKLSEATFSIDGRTITRVYANSAAVRSSQGTNGRYVLMRFSPTDQEASTIIEAKGPGKMMGRKEIKVGVTQTGDITTTDGETWVSSPDVMVNDKEINLIVDDFLKLEFKDLKTGKRLKYNLFIPKGYDKNKSYPMVVFIAGRGSNGERGDLPLIHGLGGVIWASPSEQAKHPCFVLVPQYNCQIVFDDFTCTKHLDITIDLINSITNQYNIETSRLYITGFSQGCMSAIEMSIRFPHLFTALLLVGGQWNPTAMSVLAQKNMWVIVSEGDTKAFPGMNASMVSLELAGAKISRATWNGKAGEDEFAAAISKMIAERSNIKYTVLDKGTVVPEGQIDDGPNNHVNTYRIAYTIEGLRDWLFNQVK